MYVLICDALSVQPTPTGRRLSRPGRRYYKMRHLNFTVSAVSGNILVRICALYVLISDALCERSTYYMGGTGRL